MQQDDPWARRLLTVGVVLLAVGVVAAFAWLARQVLLLAFFGVVLATVLSIPVGWLRRFMPRLPAVFLVLGVLVAAVGVGGAIAAPPLMEQAEQFREQAPKAIERIRARIDRIVSPGEQQSAVTEMIPQQVSQEALPALMGAAQGLTSGVLVAVLAVFLVSSPETYRRGARHLLPERWQPEFDESWCRVGDKLVGWLQGILVSMLINGVLVAIGLWAIGLDQWFLLAVITWLFSFVPYLGAIASAIPGLLIALSQGGAALFLSTFAVYLGVQMTEGYVLTPLVMRRAVEVQPGLLLVGQGIMTAVFGLIGTIVATPLIVCLQALVGYLWVERQLGRSPTPPDD